MTIAGELAKFSTQKLFSELPDEAIKNASMLIASSIASAAMGSEISSAQIVNSLIQEQGGTPEASIWFYAGPKVPIASAARANAMLSDAAASDDSDLRNLMHPGTNLAATCLAMAEKTQSSGQDVLAAMVLGYEVAGRIGEALKSNLASRGWHPCIVNIFSGAVGAGRLMKLNEAQMAQAIALSATSIGGLLAASRGSFAREYHAGNAALLGINAVLSAQRGYTAEESIFETNKGFVEMYGGDDPGIITRNLGEEWDINTDMAIKLAPGAHQFHALATAAANAARDGNVSPDEIDSITFWATSGRPGHKHPKNHVDAAHSSYYFVAVGVADRNFSWIHASKEKISDPIIHGLIDKIEIGDPPTENIERYKRGAVVTIKTNDGRIFTSKVYAPNGAAMNGIEWADVDLKYKTLVPKAKLSSKKIEDSLKAIHDFRDAKDVSELINLLK